MLRRTLSAVLLVAGLAAPALADLSREQREVEMIRGVAFKGPVAQKTISRTDLRAYLMEQLEAEVSVPVADYMSALRVLHLIGDEPDPVGKLMELYQSQVVAFYDPRDHIYYSLDTPPSGEGAELMQQDAVAIHELTHALQDQAFGAGTRIEGMKDDWDAAMAYHAVLEGEATLVMLASMFQSMGVELKAVLTDEAMDTFFGSAAQLTATSVPKGTPPYFVSSLTFPYLEGLRFVVAAYRRGGWQAVDEIHRKPPRSTAELIHPELYGKFKPARGLVPLQAATLGTTLGEFHWRFLLGDQAARGWAGDRVDLVKDAKGQWTVLAETRWSSGAEAHEFAEAVKKRFKDAEVREQGTTVRFAYGADRNRIRLFAPPPSRGR